MSEDSKTPTTVRELGIKLQGFEELVAVKFDTMSAEITRLVSALETSNSNKADKKDLDNLKTSFDTYVKNHERVHVEQDKRIDKKPILSTVLWSLFSSILTAVVLFEIMNAMNGGK